MATYTPNYNLEKPEASDPFENFRQSYNNNMDTIDANLGGGGGSGGHTIVDENGADMPAESKLQFTGNVSVTDDNVNGATVVDVLGGGGNVYGAFIDPSRIIANSSYSLNLSYTATEDCYIYTAVALNSNTGGSCAIDGQNIASWWNGSGGTVAEAIGSYLKKGQTFTATATNASSSGYMVYGLTQSTNGIYAPVIYSDNERVIGVWRDNKPLYAKTVNFGTLPNSTTKDVSHGIANIDKVWVAGGFAYQPNGDFSNQLSLNVPNSSASGWYFGANSSLVRCQTGSDRTNYSAFVTLYYTKTTDVAGSGDYNTYGVPTHHYSTSEQVVGTWIDNKPLYEKTVQITAFPNATTANYPHGITNADTLCDYEAKVRWASGGIAKCGGGRITLTGGNIDTNSFIGVEVDKTNIIITTKIDRRALSGEVTIRYTKTTD